MTDRKTDDIYNPYDPQNKPGFDQLPEGIACRECPGFKRYVGKPGSATIRVNCEWPTGPIDTATMVPDLDAPRGGGWLSDGTCRPRKLSD